MKFHEKLKLIRKTNKLTQDSLAEKIGISRSNLANIEGGKVQPTRVFINCIALMYKLDVNWLLDDENDDLSPLEIVQRNSQLKNFEQLDDKYKDFVANQIQELIKIQERED